MAKETCSKCGAVEGSPQWGTVGDGYDGLCPSCADAKDNPHRFTNHYRCDDCGIDWSDDWSCMCDDECPKCGQVYEPKESTDNELEV